MNIIIISIGKVKEKYIHSGIYEYKKRLNPFVKIKEIELQSESFSSSQKQKSIKIEGQRIISHLEKYSRENVYILDEHSRGYTSAEFSELLENNSEIVFVVAGSLGLSKELRDSNFKKISLSKMTFPHELARLVLFEQIYRGITIINGKKYHN